MKSEMRAKAHRLTAVQQRYQRLKHLLDAVIALAALLVLVLPILIIALVQKCIEPKEPVFFFQKRYGQGGCVFSILKFRSMKAPQGGMTPFGRFLRDTSLDELPQLIQVVQGKMSLVGPRPLDTREEEIHALRAQCGVYQLRPGLTGWAQIHGRDRLSTEEKTYFDTQYLESMSFGMDVKILWRTVGILLGLRQDDQI